MSSNPPSASEAIGTGLAPFAALIPNPLVAAGVGVLLRYGPAAFAAFVDLIHKPEPTKEDWLALLKEASGKDYDAYIEEARARAGGSQ